MHQRNLSHNLDLYRSQILPDLKATVSKRTYMGRNGEKRLERMFSEKYQLGDPEDAKRLRQNYQFTMAKKGRITQQQLMKAKQRDREQLFREAEEILKAGDVLAAEPENSLKEVKEMAKIKKSEIRINQERHSRMQVLGKNLTQTVELSKSAMRRDCCKTKRARMYNMSSKKKEYDSQIWNFKKSFQESDQAIKEDLGLNQLLNAETVSQYVTNSFLYPQQIKQRNEKYQKVRQLQSMSKDTQDPLALMKEMFKKENDKIDNHKAATFQHKQDQKQKMMQNLQKKKEIFENNKRDMNRQLPFDKEKLYSSMTQIQFQDIFASCLHERHIQAQSELKKSANVMNIQEVNPMPKPKHSIIKLDIQEEKRRKGNVFMLPIEKNKLLPDIISEQQSKGTATPSKESNNGSVKKLIVRQESSDSDTEVQIEVPIHKMPKYQQLQILNENFNSNHADNIDRHLFLDQIFKYLDEDIDEMNKKHNGKIGVSNRSKPKNINPQNTIISRSFDKQAYLERLAQIPSHYAGYNNNENEIISNSMAHCKPPKHVFISHRILKEVNNTSESYYFNPKTKPPRYDKIDDDNQIY